MTIRTRLTLWYAVALFLSVSIMLGLFWYLEHRRSGMDDDDFEEIVELMVWYGIPTAVLALGGGWWLTRRVLSPITLLARAAEQIHEGNLHTQLDRSGNGDELDRLTDTFNAMTARLDRSFQRIREFTLHASHELKTPMTILQGELEMGLVEKGLTDSRRERLSNQMDEVQRLTMIVDGLALLTKADAGQILLKQEPVRLDELVRDCYEDSQILARSKDIGVQLLQCEEATVRGDRHRLRQVLLNLSDNAIKYNCPRGKVTLALRASKGFAELEIGNNGEGIPVEMQTRVFDRFFRCDESHHREVEGCGLGLSIVQWIVTAHGGTIRIDSQPRKWTTATLRLPLVDLNP